MNRLSKWLVDKVTKREPDLYIGGKEDPYMIRWFVIPRNRFFNIYLHHFKRSDDDRALHDHPWVNLSILLEGEYTEHTIAAGGIHKKETLRAPKLRMRWNPGFAHRIELHAGDCWTLFITGPHVRSWGFHCPQGWRHWKDFVGEYEGDIGRGCD